MLDETDDQVVLLVPCLFLGGLLVSPTVHTLYSVVVLTARSAICIRAPFSAFAGPAFSGLSIVCDISHAARPGCRAKKGLPILVRLRKRALAALKAASEAARTNPRRKKVEKPEEEDDLTHLAGSAKLRRTGGVGASGSGSGKAGSVSPPARSAGGMPLPSMSSVNDFGTQQQYQQQQQHQLQHQQQQDQDQYLNQHQQHQNQNQNQIQHHRTFSNGRSPTETASTSTTLADPVQGMVPSFPADGVGINFLQTPDQTYQGLSISPTGGGGGGGANGWLGDFSPQWSDQSILYPTSSDMVSPTSNSNGHGNGLGTSYSMASDISYFPNFNSTLGNGNGNDNGMMNGNGNGNSNGIGSGSSHAMGGYDIAMGMGMGTGMGMDMGMGVDMDMSMALGLDRDGNGGVGVGGEQGGEWDVDFDAFVNNMGHSF